MLRCKAILRLIETYGYYYQLSRSEYDFCAMERIQRRKLTRLLRYCQENVLYYRDMFEEAGVDVEGDPKEQMQKLPVMSRSVVQERGFDLIPVRRNGEVRVATTSGSSGVPVRVLRGTSHKAQENAAVMRRKRNQGISLIYARIASLCVLPKQVPRRIGIGQGVSVLRLFRSNSDEFGSLVSWKPHAIYGKASSLLALAQYVQDSGAVLHAQCVVSHSEQLTPQVESFLVEVLGCRIHNEYGLEETGDIAHTVNGCQHMHIDAENVYVEEVKRDDGVAPLLVVTSLNNYAMPILRYATGDSGHLVTARCACGRVTPAILNLQGRVDSFVVRPDGRRIFPGEFYRYLGRSTVRQWWIVQRSARTIELHYCPRAAYQHEMRAQLEAVRTLCQGLELKEVQEQTHHDNKKNGTIVLLSTDGERHDLLRGSTRRQRA